MPEQGYIKDKLDLKFLFLYVLSNLDMPVGFHDLLEMVRFDEGISYMDCSDAYYELCATGHVAEEGGGAAITGLGREALSAYSNRLPSSVRREAQRSVLRTVSRLRRDAQIACDTREEGDHLKTALSLHDGRDELLRIEMLVVNRAQAAILEGNFKAQAELIYNAVLDILLRDYGAEEKNRVFREE